ncbi:hypothetical protein HDU67_005780, partial [Dinochytrium kinnereticum]
DRPPRLATIAVSKEIQDPSPILEINGDRPSQSPFPATGTFPPPKPKTVKERVRRFERLSKTGQVKLRLSCSRRYPLSYCASIPASAAASLSQTHASFHPATIYR